MELVLSPGRYGDDTPGAPFQKEEIREWSHVDRLTGMLERARVETGRWQTSNQAGCAKSYGKMVDSRERNSADGNIVQRARQQVEIFQSQGPGRSVQVVRASQWSSSRITDSSFVISPQLADLKRETQKRTNEISKNRISRQEEISERLSSLLGSFSYPVSSTVPLRRIDSKYSGRSSIIRDPKRSNSNEDLPSLSRNDKKKCQAIKIELEESENFDNLVRGPREQNTIRKNPSPIRTKLPDIKICEKKLDNPEFMGDEKIFKMNSHEAPKSVKSAIHLLPSSKSNRTLVNLINDDPKENNEIHEAKCPVTWLTSGSFVPENSIGRKSEQDDGNCREGKIESPISGPAGNNKTPKRVGFCKTEIHFAADSGKVNIVETDEKPPPTNKFRRKRRSTGIPNNKILPIVNLNYDTKIHEKTENLADNKRSEDIASFQRGHTTTVNLGSLISKNEERGFPDGQYKRENSFHEASSQGILLRLENRIYDRLDEASTADPSLDSNFPYISRVDKSSMDARGVGGPLKSARLVMNWTKNPSKIVLEKGINGVDDRGLECENIDWETNRDDDKDIESRFATSADDKSSLDEERKNIARDFIVSPAKEQQITRDNNESLLIEKEISQKKSEEFENMESTKGDKIILPRAAKRVEKSRDDYDVVCTDAENNQVLLKVVKTHEPTIARVENDHYRKKAKKKPLIKKKSSKDEQPTKNFPTEHTYVNVFTGSAPIYENYKIPPISRKVDKISGPLKKELKKVEKTAREEKIAMGNCTTRESAILQKIHENVAEKDDKLIVKSSPSSSIVSTKMKSSRENSNKTSRKLSAESMENSSLKSRSSKISKTPKLANNAILQNDRKVSVSSVSSKSISGQNEKSKSRDVVESTKRSESRQKPIEVVYQTAVYNMKNEKLSKPNQKAVKTSRGPRYLNELICGAKTKRTGDSKNKTSSSGQHSAHVKGAAQSVRHWK